MRHMNKKICLSIIDRKLRLLCCWRSLLYASLVFSSASTLNVLSRYTKINFWCFSWAHLVHFVVRRRHAPFTREWNTSFVSAFALTQVAFEDKHPARRTAPFAAVYAHKEKIQSVRNCSPKEEKQQL